MNQKRYIVLLSLLAIATLSAGSDQRSLIDVVKSGNRDSVTALATKSTVNTAEADGTTALHWAVRSNDLEMVRRLLRAGANAKPANRYGVTPLSLAALNGNAGMIGVLVEAGADPNAVLPGGQTLLMAVARTGNEDAVRQVLGYKPDVNAKEQTQGETALIWAAAENHGGVVRLLIEHGADPNLRSKTLSFPATTFGLEGVTTILPNGNWTPLMYAARQGSLEGARALAEGGADLNLVDAENTTATLIAISNAHFDVAALLTEKGANPNLADAAGMTPLYAAVDMNIPTEVYGRPARKPSGTVTSLDLIKSLLAHGADVNAQLVRPTLQKNHTPGDGTLGAGATPLMRAAKSGDVEAMRILLDYGADATIAQRNGATALLIAAGLGRGVGVFAKDEGTEADLIEAVKLCLDNGADINAVNNQGQGAMHYAVLAGDSIVALLAERGAALEVKDKQGRTPMDVAMGVGVRGRAGAPPVVRNETIALLKRLIATRGNATQAAQ